MKIINFYIITILYSFLLSSQDDHFLNINSNINNEELKAEIGLLIKDFELEKNRIEDHYIKEINRVKELRRSEVKVLKEQFIIRKELLLKKYGQERQPIETNPDKLKKIRKTKIIKKTK